MSAHPKQLVHSCIPAVLLPLPCTEAQLQHASDGIPFPATASICKGWIHSLHVVRNRFKTFYLQIELLIHHGPVCQTQCRLGPDCHMKYNPLTSQFSHASKGPQSWKISVVSSRQPTTDNLYFISHPGQISPLFCTWCNYSCPCRLGLLMELVSCQFEWGETRRTSKTFRRC